MLLAISPRAGTEQDLSGFLVTLAVLIVLVVVTGIFLLILRKRMLGERDEAMSGSVFEDLQRLRKEGKVSEVEFEYLRRCMAARVAGKEPPPRPAELAGEADELVAPPGYDLTGAPIPPEVLKAMRRRERGAE